MPRWGGDPGDGPDPLTWPVRRLTGAYSAGELSPVEVARLALARIASCNDTLGAYTTVTPELALRQARAAEREYADGRGRPLSGIPLSIKDLFHVRGVVTTLGSLTDGSVARRDSGAVRRLRAAGAVILGKTNVPEFGQSATTENLLGPPARNPWDLARTAGGSSGGAAASVAAGLATAALGSDGGGSIRIPAAFCGLFGFKPSQGTCPDEGGFRGMSAFSCPGPLTRRADDARLLLQVLAGRAYERHPLPRPLRVSWCPTLEDRPVSQGVADRVLAAVDALRDAGCDVVEQDPPTQGWNDIFRVLVLEEEWRRRGHLIESDADRLSDYERRTLVAGSRLAAKEVRDARRHLRAFRARFSTFFESWDLIALPTTAVVAFPAGQRPARIRSRPVDWLWGAFPFTPMFNVAGTPAVSLPCGLSDGLPVGIQLVAAPGREALLLDVAEALESRLGFAGLATPWSSAPGAGTAPAGRS